VVVSASLDAYLTPWCRMHGLTLICSELDVRDGVITGSYRGGDCAGPAKAARVRERLRLDDYREIHAYGDTVEDRELLALAHHPVFRWQGLTPT
jgi:HAD superfamily phosphoserine phosphatase-like hydrolase